MIHVPKDARAVATNEYATGGHARLERILNSQQPDGVRVALVHFESGSVTYWHVHPGEQVLVIISGKCRFGNEAGERIIAREGDAIYIPAGEKHWHGAVPGESMSHLAIATAGATIWLEPVEETAA